jgi:two-component system phosphate regulon sensor histidine kinase PhoR
MSVVASPRRTIWIVDDSKTDAERVRRVLAQRHVVEVMHDGATVLERLASRQAPDLLVLDWVMPDVSGLDVCRFVRGPTQRTIEIPILLLTAHKHTAQIVEGLDAGANDYLAKPFEDEELLARIGSLLRTRQHLERAVKAEESVRALLAAAPDAILAVDAQGVVTYLNEEAERVLCRGTDDVLGRPIANVVPDLSLRAVMVGPGEPLLPVPDVQIGDRIFSPLIRLLPSDSAANTTVALRDVTARRQADTRRLDFYSMIAHDLRTPLSAVLLRLELATIGKHGVLPAPLMADLRKIDANVRTLVAMINDFLELARFEGIGHKIERAPVDLADLLRMTMEDFRPLLEVEGLAWQSFGRRRDARVLGDRGRLIQVLSNLVGNAIKFTPHGGTISTTITVGDDHVEVAVADTGQGIPREAQGNLFQRYTRVPEGERASAGSGLGLMIVREIVEAHGGQVGVESGLGEGSRFWFRIPRAPREPERAEDAGGRTGRPG